MRFTDPTGLFDIKTLGTKIGLALALDKRGTSEVKQQDIENVYSEKYEENKLCNVASIINLYRKNGGLSSESIDKAMRATIDDKKSSGLIDSDGYVNSPNAFSQLIADKSGDAHPFKEVLTKEGEHQQMTQNEFQSSGFTSGIAKMIGHFELATTDGLSTTLVDPGQGLDYSFHSIRPWAREE